MRTTQIHIARQNASVRKNYTPLIYRLKHRVNHDFNKALSKIVMGWEEVAPSAIMDWAGFEFASSVFLR
jgi:hypothetical protein